jgi:hypothetical protein
MADSNRWIIQEKQIEQARIALPAHERAQETLPLSLLWHLQNKRATPRYSPPPSQPPMLPAFPMKWGLRPL